MIEVFCIRGEGDKEMQEVEDKMLVTPSDAVIRGKYEIDKQWYLIHNQSLGVPFKKTTDSTSIMDGDLVSVSDGVLGLSGNKKVMSVTISGTAKSLEMSLSTASFEEYL
jgi:hypothetical protein